MSGEMFIIISIWVRALPLLWDPRTDAYSTAPVVFRILRNIAITSPIDLHGSIYNHPRAGTVGLTADGLHCRYVLYQPGQYVQ